MMSNKYLIDSFKTLRVYRKHSLTEIMNHIICNRIMKNKAIVNHSAFLYQLSSKYIGKNFTNFILQSTYAKIFTAGNSIEDVNQVAEYFRKQGILVITNYCAEGDIHNPDLENNLDKNAFYFGLSGRKAALHKNQMISIKITALLDIRIVKKWNQSIVRRNNFWEQYKNSSNSISFKELYVGLKEVQTSITESDVIEYIKDIHNYQGEKNNFAISEFDFKVNHHPFYIYQQHKNQNRIIKLFFPLDNSQRQKINNFCLRLKHISQFQHEEANNFRITVDAQQSYVQLGIQSICEQMQIQYNQEKAYILSTLQNYLKRSPERVRYQIMLAERRNIKFGAKLVRGAYLVQETRLSKDHGYQNPVVDYFELTTKNYLGNFEQIIKSLPQGQLIVAGHNLDTVNSILDIKKRNKALVMPKVSFAQLLGLADHITQRLNSQGIPVYKCLPWAQTEVMVAYMMRRAQQLNQMKYPLDVQYGLLKHQLFSRINFS